MNHLQSWTRYGVVTLIWVTALFGAQACSQATVEPQISGLDHIPVAVADLDRAAEQYLKLGFTLKPGRAHENGIRNQHAKFADGSEIELITATEARDTLTAEYLAHLAAGDGPAFAGFYAPDMNRLADFLEAEGKTYQNDGALITFPESDELRYIFFGSRLPSPTDQPQHFQHPNGAEALIGVWFAADDFARERQLLATLAAETAEEEVYVPDRMKAAVARLPQAEIILLPGSQQLVPGRRIIGATIRTGDLDALRRVLAENYRDVPQVVTTPGRRSIFIPPDIAHGIWLEFRQGNRDNP